MVKSDGDVSYRLKANIVKSIKYHWKIRKISFRYHKAAHHCGKWLNMLNCLCGVVDLHFNIHDFGMYTCLCIGYHICIPVILV